MTTRTRPREDVLDPAAVEALVRGDHGDPFALLGMHEAPGGGLVVRTFQPRAGRVWLIDAATGRPAGEMSRRHAGRPVRRRAARPPRSVFPIACASRSARRPARSPTPTASRRSSASSTST